MVGADIFEEGTGMFSIPDSIAELIVVMNMPYVRIASIAKCEMRSAVCFLLDGLKDAAGVVPD